MSVSGEDIARDAHGSESCTNCSRQTDRFKA